MNVQSLELMDDDLIQGSCITTRFLIQVRKSFADTISDNASFRTVC